MTLKPVSFVTGFLVALAGLSNLHCIPERMRQSEWPARAPVAMTDRNCV
jgi:hypothetical protein